MKPHRAPGEILGVWFEVWAAEGFELYWKLSPRWKPGERKGASRWEDKAKVASVKFKAAIQAGERG